MTTAAERRAAAVRTEIKGLEIVALGGRPLGSVANARLQESVLVKAFTEFEAFLEELFFAILEGRTRVPGARPHVRLRDPAVARQIVLQPRERYLTWLPIREATVRAERFLVDGSPFDRLATRRTVTGTLSRAQIVRNATAHRSDHAQEQFQSATGRRFATAGDYLASRSGTSTMCVALLDDLARYCHALVGSVATAESLLGPPDPLKSGQVVGSGDYACQGCGAIVSMPGGTALACMRCDPPCGSCGHVSKTAAFRPI